MCFSSFQSKTSCCSTNTELENNYYCVVPLMKTSHQGISIAKFNVFCFCFGSVKHKAIPENTLIAKVYEHLRFSVVKQVSPIVDHSDPAVFFRKEILLPIWIEKHLLCNCVSCNELRDFMYSMHFEFIVFILHWPTCSAFFRASGNCISLVHQRNTPN